MSDREARWLGPESHWDSGWMQHVVHPDDPNLTDRTSNFFQEIIIPCIEELGLEGEFGVDGAGEKSALAKVYEAVQLVEVDSIFGQSVNWIHIMSFSPSLALFMGEGRGLQKSRVLAWAALSALRFLQSTPNTG